MENDSKSKLVRLIPNETTQSFPENIIKGETLVSYKNHCEKINLLSKKYPDLSKLDLHYLSMKCLGIQDSQSHQGRPSINIFDNKGLYHITFTTNEQNSPYCFENETILCDGNILPFQVVYVERIPVRVRRHYYLRGSQYMTPSLEDEKILNLNFHHQCYHCGFCQNLVCGSQSTLTPKDGFKLIMSRGDIKTLSDIAEIAIVTGSFDSEEKAFEHIYGIIDEAARYEFHGRLFYMGHELRSEDKINKIRSRIVKEGMISLKIVYTVEMFANRQRFMSGHKSDNNLDEIADILQKLSKMELYDLQYSYMPGLDDLEDFKRGAERLVEYATPHISIYRPFFSEMREAHICSDYKRMNEEYLCQIRTRFEELCGGPIIGNNLGNMFSFPINRISERWLNGAIVGTIQHMRYWSNQERPVGWRVTH